MGTMTIIEPEVNNSEYAEAKVVICSEHGEVSIHFPLSGRLRSDGNWHNVNTGCWWEGE